MARGSGDNGRMEIVLNGAPHPLPHPVSIADLLAEAGLGERRVAVELNGAIVPRSQHASRLVEPGDRIEIVHALGGG